MIPPHNQRPQGIDPRVAHLMRVQLRVMNEKVQKLENQVKANMKGRAKKSIISSKFPIMSFQTEFPGFKRTGTTVKTCKLQKWYTVSIHFTTVILYAFL